MGSFKQWPLTLRLKTDAHKAEEGYIGRQHRILMPIYSCWNLMKKLLSTGTVKVQQDIEAQDNIGQNNTLQDCYESKSEPVFDCTISGKLWQTLKLPFTVHCV